MNPWKSRPARPIGTQFYIYRNFYYPARRHQHIVLHHADCMYCNSGLGRRGLTPRVSPDHPIEDFPKRAWIGPFESIGAANAWISYFPYAVGRIPERCSLCCRVPDFWPVR